MNSISEITMSPSRADYTSANENSTDVDIRNLEPNSHLLKLLKETLENPTQELDRLRAEGFIDSEFEIFKTTSNPSSKRLNPFIPILYAKAFAIKNMFKETHHVFLHAQTKKMITCTYLIKELMKQKMPEMNLKEFKFLRFPSYLEEHLSPGIDLYRDTSLVDDHEIATKNDLISVDGYFANTTLGESAYYFFRDNLSVEDSDAFILNCIQNLVRKFYPMLEPSSAGRFSREIASINQTHKRELLDGCGNLYVFCIPKETSSTIQYRSHPKGIPCTCHPERASNELLDDLQEGHISIENQCKSYPSTPQYRLYAPELRPGKNQKVYLLSPIPKSTRKAMKLAIRLIISNIESNTNNKKKLEEMIN